MARTYLDGSPHHASIEVYEGDRRVGRLLRKGEGSARPEGR